MTTSPTTTTATPQPATTGAAGLDTQVVLVHTNDAHTNQIIAYARSGDGALTRLHAYSTGAAAPASRARRPTRWPPSTRWSTTRGPG